MRLQIWFHPSALCLSWENHLLCHLLTAAHDLFFSNLVRLCSSVDTYISMWDYINLFGWPKYFLIFFLYTWQGKKPNQNYSEQKWKIAELFCRLFCHFLQKHSTNLAFLKEFCKNWQNNPQNNLAIFQFGTQ